MRKVSVHGVKSVEADTLKDSETEVYMLHLRVFLLLGECVCLVTIRVVVSRLRNADRLPAVRIRCI